MAHHHDAGVPIILMILLGTIVGSVAFFGAAIHDTLSVYREKGSDRVFGLSESLSRINGFTATATYNKPRILKSSTLIDDIGNENSPTFVDMYKDRLPPWLLSRLESLGYHRPTMVQREALDAILDGEDVIIQAQTGTGKTLAFMLPLLTGIDTKKKAVQALVVVPSRELGLQVASVAKQLAAGRVYYQDEELLETDGEDNSTAAETQQEKSNGSNNNSKILIMSLLEGSKNRRQRAWALAEAPHVVIGNPLALSRMVEQGGIKYHQVKMVVIDEVDACLTTKETRAELQALLGKYLSPSYLTAALEEEAQKQLNEAKDPDHELLSSLPQGAMKSSQGASTGTALAPWKLVQRQTIFASATIPQHNHFIKQCLQQQWTLKPPTHVHVTPGELLPPQVHHSYLVCPSKTDKISALRSYLRREAVKGHLRACIVFAAEDDEAVEVSEGIADIVSSLSLQSSSSKQQGKKQIEAEREGEASSSDKKKKKEEAAEAEEPQALLSQDHIRRRAHIMDNLRSGRSHILVTTDFAARGLDIPHLTHVIMYDIPSDAETYLHRSGRTGRLGRKGWTTSLVSETEEFALLRLVNSLKIQDRLKKLGVMKKRKKAPEKEKSSRRRNNNNKKSIGLEEEEDDDEEEEEMEEGL